jgi:hypothetical protein
MKKIILLILIALSANNILLAQGQFTTQGRDFRIAFGPNPNTGGVFQLRMVASNACTVTVTYVYNNSSVAYNLAAGEVRTVTLDATQRTNSTNSTTGTSSKSIRVVSTEDIALFAINMANFITDATNVLPVTNYGTEYRHISYNNQGVNGGTVGDGYFVIAHENGTVVKHNGTTVATLNAGQIYSRYSGVPGDFTGIEVTTSHPAAYIVFNDCVLIPNGVYACDCLFQQLPPISSWGNKFLVPVTSRGKDRIRIVASQTTTINQVGGSGAATITLNAGQYHEMEVLTASNGCYISASKPVAVAAYLIGLNNFTGVNAVGDPAMAWVPPIEQNVAHTSIAPFSATANSVLTTHFALIIAPTAYRNVTTVALGTGVDQALFGGTWVTNAASGYSYYSMPLTNTTQTYTYKNANGLMIMGYGLGNYESYYYMAAASSRQLDPAFYINDIHFQDALDQSYCDDDFEFKASIQYPLSTAPGHLIWTIDGVEYMAARDQNTWTLPKGYLLGPPQPHYINLHITDSYNGVKDVETHFTVLAIPPAVQASNLSAASICSGTAPTVSVAKTSTGLTYRVFTALTGGTQVGSGAGTGGTINIACTGNLTAGTTYYVDAFNGVCPSSPRTPIAITVVPIPTIPALTAAAICNGSSPVIHLATSVSGVTYGVYTASSGGTAITTANGTGAAMDITLSTTPSATTTYWVGAANGSCLSTSRGSVSVTVNPKPALTTSNITTTNASCNGGTGTITVTATGVNAYSKDDGATWQASNSFTGLTVGAYQIKVRTSAGCVSDAVSATITQPSSLDASVSAITAVLCYGGTTGTITISASGGVSPYQYKLGTGSYQSGNSFTVAAGTYTVTVKDANGCEKVISDIVVTQPTALDASYTTTAVVCYGETTGKITITASGGTSPYQYKLGTGTYQSGAVFTVAAGTYTVTVRDNKNCEKVISGIIVTQPTALTATAVITDLTCNGGTPNGAISITASGGTPSYVYSFDSGSTYQTSNTLSGMSIGAYGVKVKDSNGCIFDFGTLHVSQPQSLSVPTPTQTNVSCNGGSDGTITVSGVSGGTPPYQYSFAGGTYSTTNSKTGLSAGTYTVQVKDNQGCLSSVINVTITQPPIILTSADVSTATACPNLPATITINNTVTGVIYKIFDAATGGTLITSVTGDGTTKNVIIGTIPVTKIFYIETLSGTCVSVTRVPITVNVYTTLTAGTVAAPQTICYGATPDALTQTTAPSGSTGSYTYRWQISADNSVWNDIAAGATSAGYQPVALYATTYYRRTVMSCDTVYTPSVKITVRPQSLYDYPDIRANVCSDISPLNLGKYLDTTSLLSVSWTKVSGADISLNGTVSSGLPGIHTHTYKYTITNHCVTGLVRKFYLQTITTGETVRPLRDTIVVCWEKAEALQLNQIFGIDAGGYWIYDASLNTHVYEIFAAPYTGAKIFNGKTAYQDTGIPFGSYHVPLSKTIVFKYKAALSGCLSGKEYTIVIVLTPNIVN